MLSSDHSLINLINKVIKDIENKKGQFDITNFETIKNLTNLKFNK